MPGADQRAHRGVGDRVVAGVDRDERERAPLEEEGRGEGRGDPADAGRRARGHAEAERRVGTEEHREVRRPDERAERGAAEHARQALLQLGVLEADEALPRAAEEQRRVPEAAEQEREEGRADDRGPVERGGIHAVRRAGPSARRGRFRDESAPRAAGVARREDERGAGFE